MVDGSGSDRSVMVRWQMLVKPFIGYESDDIFTLEYGGRKVFFSDADYKEMDYCGRLWYDPADGTWHAEFPDEGFGEMVKDIASHEYFSQQ